MIDTNRLALGIDPNSVLSVAEMVECARLAETRGFAATWVAEGRRGEGYIWLAGLNDPIPAMFPPYYNDPLRPELRRWARTNPYV
jgi:alkanesulfonate monooxygenase SsuD/methylene tetrahydromethanopterin reductase-like flavin-dependent oxidoreductase (luciferase family)